MKVLQSILVIVGLSLLMGLPFGVALSQEIALKSTAIKQGPAYWLPSTPKPQLLRFVCYWNGHRLTCGPAIGKKEWIDD